MLDNLVAELGDKRPLAYRSFMIIQINAPNVAVPTEFQEFIEKRVGEVLKPFSQQLTRLEVHLKDQAANKGGVDKRCLLEARPRGLDPIAVDCVAASETDAVRKALDKLKKALDHRFGRMSER